MNISEGSEIEMKKCTDYDTYCGANDLSPFLLDVIESHQLAPTGDPLVDEDAAVPAYHTMKQNLGESTNKYQVRMEDTVKIIERLGTLLPTPQQQARRYLES